MPWQLLEEVQVGTGPFQWQLLQIHSEPMVQRDLHITFSAGLKCLAEVGRCNSLFVTGKIELPMG